jgi:hypothetical protein
VGVALYNFLSLWTGKRHNSIGEHLDFHDESPAGLFLDLSYLCQHSSSIESRPGNLTMPMGLSGFPLTLDQSHVWLAFEKKGTTGSSSPSERSQHPNQPKGMIEFPSCD